MREDDVIKMQARLSLQNTLRIIDSISTHLDRDDQLLVIRSVCAARCFDRYINLSLMHDIEVLLNSYREENRLAHWIEECINKLKDNRSEHIKGYVDALHAVKDFIAHGE